MKIHLQDTGETGNLIRSFTADSIIIGDLSFSNSLAVGPGKLISDWTEVSGDALRPADIEVLVEFEPELILLGTGAGQYFPSPQVLQAMIERQIGFEIMTTAAACRTYNVLVGEGREVVAGLILPA